MNLVKLLISLVFVAFLGYLAYTFLYRTRLPSAEKEAPNRPLENVRLKAKQIELEDEKRLKELEKKAFGE